MNYSRSTQIVLALLISISKIAAQEAVTHSPEKISITVSNRSELDLTLRLMEGLPPPPALGEPFHPHKMEVVTKTVKSNHADRFELLPGQYHLESSSSLSSSNGPMVPLFGYISVTNVGSSRVDLQACKLEYSIVSPK